MVAMLNCKWQLVFFTVLVGLAVHLQGLPAQDEPRSFPVNLDQPIHLQSKKHPKSRCVLAKWKRLEAGSGIVRYFVAFRDSSGEVLEAGIGYNIRKIKACNSRAYASVTDVELTISFKGTSKTINAKVSEVPTNTPVITAPSTPSRVSSAGIAALALLFGLVVIFVAYVALRPHLQHCIRK